MAIGFGVFAIISFVTSIFVGIKFSNMFDTFDPSLDLFKNIAWLTVFSIGVGIPLSLCLLAGLVATLQYTFYLETRIKKLES